MKIQSPGIIDYLQCDVTDLSSVHLTFKMIQEQSGPIRHIIHTGGVVKDNTLYKVTEEEFERVLGPKVLGAWNLHIVSQEMELDLDNFVVTSSIRYVYNFLVLYRSINNHILSFSVPLGNPGQAAYVAGNAFMDSLVTYRQSLGLPGVSLQLGAWESQLVQTLDLTKSIVSVMSHERGIPLFMNALTCNEPVQVIAKLNLRQLANDPSLVKDPIYRELLVGVSEKNSGKPKLPDSRMEVEDEIVKNFRDVLELGPEDELG